MKKKLAIIMAALMLASFTACGSADVPVIETEGSEETTSVQPPEDISDNGDTASDADNTTDFEIDVTDVNLTPVEILNTVWSTYGEDELFSAMGGGYESMVDGAPGAISMSDVDSLVSIVYCPADCLEMIDGAASLIHLNSNTFTGAVFHLKNAADAQAFADAVERNLTGNQWLCGFPEKVTISTVEGEFAVLTFGAVDIVDNFTSKLTVLYTNTEILVDGPIV